MIMGYYEMPEEDRPPEAIWLQGKLLTEHFDRIKAKYKAKASGMEPIEVMGGETIQNPFTAGIKR